LGAPPVQRRAYDRRQDGEASLHARISVAYGINDAGQVVGVSGCHPTPF
jgi:hypothetical protein